MKRSRTSGRTLRYEPLEPREMLAVSATLKGGVLKIKGSKAANQVYFNQNNGIIAISGVKNTFAASQVNSIVINLSKGNDYISLDSLANGGSQASPKPSPLHRIRKNSKLSTSPTATTSRSTGPDTH